MPYNILLVDDDKMFREELREALEDYKVVEAAGGREAVEKVARLAALKLEPAQLETYTKKFAAVLEYIEELNKIDTKGIEPTSHAEDISDLNLREDVSIKFDAADMISRNFPRREGNLNAVPKVIESE